MTAKKRTTKKTIKVQPKEKSWDERAAEIGAGAMSSIRDMVAAYQCDYDRLEELRDEENPSKAEKEELAELLEAAGDCESKEDAERRIQEDPLSLQFRSGWCASREEMEPEEFELLLGTGGPAVRIIGEIDNGEACNPILQVQDWFKPWTQHIVTGDDYAALEAYCRCFYMGE